MTSKKEQDELDAALKYGSGPVVIRQGSVASEFFDKFGVGPVVVDDPEVPANSGDNPVSASAVEEEN